MIYNGITLQPGDIVECRPYDWDFDWDNEAYETITAVVSDHDAGESNVLIDHPESGRWYVQCADVIRVLSRDGDIRSKISFYLLQENFHVG